MSKRTFAKALRQARLKAGLSQAELGARVGLTGSYISQLEAGHRRPLIGRRIDALCKALGIACAPLQEAAELERSSPNVRKKIEAVHRDRGRLQRVRDRLLLSSAWIASRQGGVQALDRIPDLPDEQRRLAQRLFGKFRGVDGFASVEREAERILAGIKPGQRDALLRLTARLLEQADPAPPLTNEAAHERPERATLVPTARVVACHPAPPCADEAFYWRMPDDSAHPRIEADDLLLLSPAQAPRDGTLVVVLHQSRGHVRRLVRQGSRLRLESLRPDVPPLRLPDDPSVKMWEVVQLVRAFA